MHLFLVLANRTESEFVHKRVGKCLSDAAKQGRRGSTSRDVFVISGAIEIRIGPAYLSGSPFAATWSSHVG